MFENKSFRLLLYIALLCNTITIILVDIVIYSYLSLPSNTLEQNLLFS